MLKALASPPGPFRRFTAYLLALLVALSSLTLLPMSAQANELPDPEGSPITITDIAFENDAFPDGSRQALHVTWEIDGTAENPVTVTVDIPEGLRGHSDSFAMAGPDGEVAGECIVTADKIVCTADEDFINNNPEDVSGEFWFNVNTTFENREEFEHTFDIGGFDNTVTIGSNPNWCTENCDFGQLGAGKGGGYTNGTDTIVWRVTLPGGSQGIEAGKYISVTDLMDSEDYTLLTGNGYPKVVQANTAQWHEKWGSESLVWQDVPADKNIEWSDDNLTATFEADAGPGQDFASDDECTTGEGATVPCTSGFDGTFYQVQWQVQANTGGELQANGRDRTFYNDAEYTIEGTETKAVSGSSTRYSGGGNVVGTNYGQFRITKDLSGDTTLNPEFAIDYSYTEPGQESQERSAKFRSGEWHTSQEFYKGTSVTINEVAPTDPDNVTWKDPVFVQVDADGTENLITMPHTFDAVNGNLGKLTQLRLKNEANLDRDVFSAKKSLVNEDNVPLTDDLTFALDYTYPADEAKGFPAGSGTLTLPANGELVPSDELPVGAVLTLSEAAPTAIPGTAWGSPSLSTDTVTIGEGDAPAEVNVTNTITQDLGGFALTKAVTGEGESLVPEGTEFTVNYSYTAVNGFPAGSGEFAIKAGETSEEISNIPAGAVVTLDEVAPVDPLGGTWGEPQFDIAEFTVVNGQIATISLDNPISWNTGNFSVQKVVEGDASHLVAEDVAFTVDYSYVLPEALGTDPGTGEGTLTVHNDGEAITSEPLPYNTEVTLSETAPSPIASATWTGAEFDNSSFTIGDKSTFAGSSQMKV